MSRCLMKVLSSGNLGVAARIGLCQDFPVGEKPSLLLLGGWLEGIKAPPLWRASQTDSTLTFLNPAETDPPHFLPLSDTSYMPKYGPLQTFTLSPSEFVAALVA